MKFKNRESNSGDYGEASYCRRAVLTGETEDPFRVLEIVSIDLGVGLLLHAFRNIHCTTKMCTFITYASTLKKCFMIR